MNTIISNEPIFASVIIPVFNDARRLALCLDALGKQHIETPNLSYEVIVIDNNSTEDIKSVCSKYDAKYVFEKKPGSYAARNKGVALAQGEYLAFTDSDCIPDAHWLENGISTLLQNKEVSMLGGDIQVFSKNEKYSLGDIYDFAFAFPQKTYIQRNHFAATANMFTSKKVLEQVGPFNGEMASGGDYEWGQRVYKAGLKQMFTPKALVKHPTRSDINAVINKTRRVNGNYHRKYFQSKTPLKSLFKYMYEMVGIHVPIKRAFTKLRNAKKREGKQLSLTQNIRLFFLLILLHYVEVFAKTKEWFKLKRQA